MDRKYVLSSFAYAIAGLVLGIYMAASKNHSQLVTHAHIMLLGFVVSFIYGLCHKLWLDGSYPRLARLQYYSHHIGSLVLFVALFLLYQRSLAATTLDPILALASITVLVSVILMATQLIKTPQAPL
ncbi:TonB-dependent receptor [Dasania sp. GY-MA-18]|uniref:TonB-dependent receptor n=1 Tax=Dasania phycosphaerae TaxID=2950436 RepID=A0A9J6RL39_9GAMM|nr:MULTISPECIES: TonB-dependent receptor [Dasania]MCR8922289.1 TonB-dependent receptor [Dasania sp. GY-MA-18]MCZ0864717.1 TonB-dependent receptor [Dasania phycosphaerae]MCZ0868445.1 TonB-dependent receptor [Dasania phycosphaerae]